jgi:hypothetical protein
VASASTADRAHAGRLQVTVLRSRLVMQPPYEPRKEKFCVYAGSSKVRLVPRTPSEADQQAINHAAAAQLEITPRQLERWRQADVIPRAARSWPGRGSVSRYAADELDSILSVARVTREGTKVKDAPIRAFRDGLPIAETVLRQALVRKLQASASVVPSGLIDTTSFGVAEAIASTSVDDLAATPTGRRATRRLRRAFPDENAHGILRGAIAEIVHVERAGIPASEDGFSEALTALGLDRMTQVLTPQIGSLAPEVAAPDIARNAAALSTENLLQIAREASIPEILQGFDDLRRICPFLRLLAYAARAGSGQRDALGLGEIEAVSDDDPRTALLMVHLRRSLGHSFEDVLRLSDDRRPRLEALHLLVNEVPEAAKYLFSAGGLDETTSRQVGDFARRHPSEAALLQ